MERLPPAVRTSAVKRNWLVIIALGLAAAADPATTDRDRIQGTWVLVATETGGQAVPPESLKARNMKMVFDGDQVYARSGEKSVPLGTFALDPSQRPKHYNRTYPDGSPRLGIYRLEGDTLTICVGGLKQARPTEFATKTGDTTSLVVYKRE